MKKFPELLGELLEAATGKLKKSVRLINWMNALDLLLVDNVLQLANPEKIDLVSEESLDKAICLIGAIIKVVEEFGDECPVPTESGVNDNSL